MAGSCSNSPSGFGYPNNSLTPLHSPSTDYLTTMPQCFGPVPTTPTRIWHHLPDLDSDTTMQRNVSVPDPPTPRSANLQNDTPTPAEQTPGSWRARRRTGEHVERGRTPALRLNAPDSILSTSPDIQASPEAEPASFAGRSSDSRHSYLEPFPDLPTHLPETRQSSSSSSSARRTKPKLSLHIPVDPLPLPPAAKVATHHSQLDGTQDEHEPSRPLRPVGSCEKLRGSMRRIPAQLKDLFSKDKPTKDEGDGVTSQEAPKSSTRGQEKATWWSTATKRFRKKNVRGKKPVSSRAGKKSARNSLRHLFSSSAASEEENRFDNPLAPQAFGAPTDEHDTNSLTEPAFAEQDEATERRWNETQCEQSSSSNAQTAVGGLDGSTDQQDRKKSNQGSGSSALLKAFIQGEKFINRFYSGPI